MLHELTIEKYRCFRKLHVKDLAQVNLIVGKNNVGKSSFLEAVYLYVSGNSPKALLEILSAREQTDNEIPRRVTDGSTNYYHLSELFNTRDGKVHFSFLISSDLDNILFVELTNSAMTSQFGKVVKLTHPPRPTARSHQWEVSHEKVVSFLPVKEDFIISSDTLRESLSTMPDSISQLKSNLVDSRGLNIESMRKLWDEINLTVEEDTVESAMKILEPDLERIGFTSRQTSLGAIKVRIKGNSDPVSLSSLGDGMRRILGLAMSLAISKGGYLVIDEIDTGLHYKAQTAMWRLVLETAKRLNIQVFATTHSWDCIAAFQAALADMEDQSIGKLFRIDARGDEVRAIEYDAEELEVAVSHGIEVR